MVDFVRLQQSAADFAQRTLSGKTIATAWPYSAGLRNPDYGFVRRGFQVWETGDFHYDSVRKAVEASATRELTVEGPNDPVTALIIYTRTWMPDKWLDSISGHPSIARPLLRVATRNHQRTMCRSRLP